jgi:hypothetical protein
MKQVIVYSRKELTKMLDALDITEQYYDIAKLFLQKETGLVETSEIKPAWVINYGDQPMPDPEETPAIGFRMEHDDYEEEDEEEYDDEEDFEDGCNSR